MKDPHGILRDVDIETAERIYNKLKEEIEDLMTLDIELIKAKHQLMVEDSRNKGSDEMNNDIYQWRLDMFTTCFKTMCMIEEKYGYFK